MSSKKTPVRGVAAQQQIDAWATSKESFFVNASPEERQSFKKCSLSDVQKHVAQLKKANTSEVGRCVEKFLPFIEGIQTLDSVIGPLASLAPYSIGDIVWGSVKMLLNFASKYVKFFESIDSFMSDIGKDLDRLQILGKIYATTTPTRFSDALAKVFTKYLAFYSYTKEYLESSHSRKFRESLGLTRHPKQAMVNLAVNQVHEACEEAIKEADLADKQSRVQADKDQSEALDRVETALDAKLLNEYLTWLQHIDPKPIIADLLNTRKNTDTCIWLFECDDFSDWLLSSKTGHNIFWLTGETGVGKSTLAATIINELTRRLEPNRATAYFFCRQQDQKSRSLEAILRSWIWQLLTKPRGAKVAFFKLPETEKDFINSKEPTCEQLCDVMRELFTQGKEATLILDGLDECLEPLETYGGSQEMQGWENFFALLRDLPSTWKLFLVSRSDAWFEPIFEESLGHAFAKRTITGEENKEDILTIIDLKLSAVLKRNKWTQKTFDEVYNFLCTNARGVFVWVNLTVSALLPLKGRDEDKIPAKLKSAPLGLGDAYDRSIQAIKALPSSQADCVLSALEWLLCALRPLTFEELQEALKMEIEMDEDSVLPPVGTFFKVDPKSKQIMLVHASCRDYLLSEKAVLPSIDAKLKSDQAKLGPVHAIMLARCLEKLKLEADRCGETFVEVDDNTTHSEEEFRKRLTDDPFLEYSAVFWVQHLVEVSKVRKCLLDVQDAVVDFLQSDVSVVGWLQIFHFMFQHDYPGSAASRQLITSLFNNSGLAWCKYVEENGPRFVQNLGLGDGGRFVRWDRFTYIQHDLDWDDDETRFDQSPTYLSAMSVAAFFNYRQVLEQLVDAGGDLKATGPLHDTPLIWAAAADSCATLQVLIDNNVNLEVKYKGTTVTPILFTVHSPRAVPQNPGTFPATLLLHKAGASLNPLPLADNDMVERTVLTTLIERQADSPGGQELTKAIMNDDQATQTEACNRGSILQAAAYYGRPLVVQVLLENDKMKRDINRQYQGGAAIHDGCMSNDPEVVQILIDNGADVKLRSGTNDWAPLHFAVTSGGATIRTLLEHGADVMATTEGGNTAMHVAAANNKANIDFRVFFDHDYEIETENDQGLTPLAVALKFANFEVVRKLLDLGADPDNVPQDIMAMPHMSSAMLDPRLRDQQREFWKACTSFKIFWMLQQHAAAQLKTRRLPTPIITQIATYAGIFERLTASREEEVTVDARITERGGDKTPYLTSPPIFGGASIPVHRIEMKVCGHCQYFGGEYDSSFYQTKTIDGNTNECIDWKPWREWGHNGREADEKELIIDIEDCDEEYRKNIHQLRSGDRVAIVPQAVYTYWTCTTIWATIAVDISALRDRWHREERDEVWQHKDCTKGRCLKCVAEKIWKEQEKQKQKALQRLHNGNVIEISH